MYDNIYDENPGIEEVLRLVQPRIKREARGSGEMEIYCPLNNEETFEVNLDKGQFKCWQNCASCPVEGKGGSVNLYRLWHPTMSFYEAKKDIIEGNGGTTCDLSQFSIKKMPVVKESELAPIEIRDAVYRELLSMLSLSQKHKKDLKKRGLSDKDIERFGAKSLPVCGQKTLPKRILEVGLNLAGVPLFAKRKGEWILTIPRGKEGFFIPYYDEEGRIQQLQIRFDVVQGLDEEAMAEAKKMRYRWASSAGYEEGCSATNATVFWGFNKPKDNVVFVTEGGLKATVAGALSGDAYAAIPGVSCYQAFRDIVSECKEKGLKIMDAFDMDGKIQQGERIVKDDGEKYILLNGPKGERQIKRSVYEALKKLHQIAEEEGVEIESWTWNPEYKGVDDYLLAKHQVGDNCEWNKTENETVKIKSKTAKKAVAEKVMVPFWNFGSGPLIPVNLPDMPAF